MSEEKQQQTVVDSSNGVAKPTPATDNAPDDLDSLLSEFETATRPENKVEQPATDDEIKAFIREERQRRTQEEQERLIAKTKEDINNAVQTIRDGVEFPVKVSDRVIRGILHDLAAENPKFANAFQNREQNPGAWKKVLKSVQAEIKKEFSVDPQATEVHDAVAAAVRSASNSAPEPKEEFNEKAVRRMSIGELTQKYPELNKNF